jgi:FAD-dependent urate hydroxylase
VEQSADAVTALFEDGSSVLGDLMVAADGTHSILRDHVIGSAVGRRYCGYVNWNGLVDAAESIAPAGAWITHVGDGKRVSTMPVAGNRLYYFFDAPIGKGEAWDREETREELQHHFKGWAAPVKSLIARLDPMSTNRVEIHDVAPLTRLVRGRVALVGDSGHSTAPDLGQGGCQALESAWVLASALRTNNLGIEDCLLRYQAQRIERVSAIITAARKRSDITHAIEPEKTAAWYEELRDEDGSGIMDAIARNILAGPLH